jgi:hypothetical protein
MAKKFTAADARALTQKHTARIDEYLDIIETAAKTGKSECTISLRLIGDTEQDPDQVVKALKALGFKAQWNSDQRDGEYYTISW